ncbi:MAG TPA: hypothetical protein VLK37_08815 [Solirubrobacterales bacterium]|nr:hypothetical protein [Solirubrobacterales bacterium]
MATTAAALLALCFDDLEALGEPTVLGKKGLDPLAQFGEWAISDLLVDRFPEIGRPTLRYEVQSLIAGCGGDPLALLRQTIDRLDEAPVSSWNERFPLDVFADVPLSSYAVDFAIADAHLHSGASVPLPLFFSALASVEVPIARKALLQQEVLSRSGESWELFSLLIAARWSIRLLRELAGGVSIHDYARLEELNFRHALVDMVIDGSFWREVSCLSRGEPTETEDLAGLFSVSIPYNGLGRLAEVFWWARTRSEDELPSRWAFLIGLLRSVCAIAGVVRARAGDGLSRFVDRFKAMGLARDLAVGKLKTQVIKSTLEHIGGSPQMVGAEFRKTVAACGRAEFKSEILESLVDHHKGFVSFVEDKGRNMALSMPVGFRRQPCTGRGGDWTDLSQLREAIDGFEALRLVFQREDGERLAKAISSIDVAGDEYGSASWPFAAAAALLEREKVPLRYVIHAGEAFYSQLNGVRRVGELFLADRVPERIGHALALSEGAAGQICGGAEPPPIRFGDAICDLSWAISVGCCDKTEAGDLLYALVLGTAGEAYAPNIWIAAYRRLFNLDALFEHRLLDRTGGVVSVPDEETLRECAMAGSPDDRAFAALAWGFDGPDLRLPDVKALVPDTLRRRLQRFEEAAAPLAREHVRGLLGTRDSESKTTIESCPTSNVRLANLGDLRGHPVWEWKQAGLQVVIGSDDPTIFGATIGDEFKGMLGMKDGPSHETCVREVAADTVACCSGGYRRTLKDLQAVVASGGRRDLGDGDLASPQ